MVIKGYEKVQLLQNGKIHNGEKLLKESVDGSPMNVYGVNKHKSMLNT